MGAIFVEGRDSFYRADAGYVIPVKPKTRTVYDDVLRKNKVVPDYSLEDLDSAASEYVRMSNILDVKFPNVFKMQHSAPRGRIVMVSPSVVYESEHAGYDSNFFVFNLQNGMVFNIPVTKLGELVGKDLLKNSPLASKVNGGTANGNQGYTVDDAVWFLDSIYVEAEKIFARQGEVFTMESFSMILGLFRLRSHGVIFGDLVQWFPYIQNGVNVDSIKFAFNRRLWGSGVSPVPFNQIEEFKVLPAEWAKKLLTNS